MDDNEDLINVLDNYFYETVFEQSIDAICVVDKEGNIRSVNPAMCELTGFTNYELLFKSITDFIPDKEDLQSILFQEKLPFEGKFKNFQGRIKRKDNVSIYVEINSTPIKNEIHNYVGSINIIRNITEKKNFEDQIKHSHKQYERAMKASNLGLWEWLGVDKQEEWWSDKVYDLLGFKPGEIAPNIDNFFKFIHPEDKQYAIESQQEHLFFGTPFNIEIRLKQKNGNFRWFRLTGNAHQDENGKILSFSGTLEDIHERKIASNALIESEEKFRHIVINSEAIIFIVNNDGIFELSEGNGLKSLGLYPGEVVGRSAFEMYKHNPQIIECINLALKGQSIRDEIIENDCCLDVFYSPVRDANKKITKIIGMAYDITERKKFEQILQEAKQQAERSDKLKTAFLSNMSHEIRTPMNAILGFSELLKYKQLDKEEQEYYIDTIIKKGDYLLQIINDIIDISKIETGNFQYQIEPINVRDFFNESVTNLTEDFSLETNQNLEFKSQTSDMPNDLLMFADPYRLNQVVLNFYQNAKKFTHEGYLMFGVLPPSETEVVFYMKDTGIGIDPKDHEKIFERFIQADHASYKKFEGTGLGLAISKNIIQLMNGRIWLESEKDHGSTFYFSVPLMPN